MKSGESLELISDDMGAKEDIPALVRKTRCIHDLKEEGKDLIFLIRKE
jgi:TusA-related sulfurtransferase